MSKDNRGSLVFGLILIGFPIAALLFGSNEPAMQTDQAGLLMTAMIIIGVITIANSRNKQVISQTTQSPAPIVMDTQVTQPIINTSSFCPFCGVQVTSSSVRYCASCGKELPNT